MTSYNKRKEQVNELRKAHFPFGFEGTLHLTKIIRMQNLSTLKSTESTNLNGNSKEQKMPGKSTSLWLIQQLKPTTFLNSKKDTLSINFQQLRD